MRPALFRDLGIVGALLVLLASILVVAPRGLEPTIPGSTVKLIVGNGHGSAVHIGNGFLITAAHVVRGGDPGVILDDGSKQAAHVLWANNEHDIALVRTDSTMASARMDCRVASAGERVSMRGNPAALDFVTAHGRVAGKETSVGPWKRVLPIDGTIVMGMSGGPVFADDGRLIGINVGVLVAPINGMFPSLTGFGFIVPASAVCDLLAWSAIA